MSLHAKTTTVLAALVISLSTPATWADDDDDDDVQRGPVQVTVDCSTQSIQDALRRARHARGVVVRVRGTCIEDVAIKRDGVTLQGKEPEGGAVRGTITVSAARHVAFKGLDVTGPGSGIVATEGAQIEVSGAEVNGNEVNGIVVEQEAHAAISNSTVNSNGANLPADSIAGHGVLVTDSASARITGSDISGNRCDGVAVFNHSFARLVGNSIEGNSRIASGCGAGVLVALNSLVRSNGNAFADNQIAVGVLGTSYFRDGNFVLEGEDPGDPDVIVQVGCTRGALPGSCGEPGTDAVQIFRSSLAEFRNAEITGEISVGGSSSFEARGSEIFGNIFASSGSGVLLRETVTGNGSLFCADGQGGPGSPGSAFSFGDVPCGGSIPSSLP